MPAQLAVALARLRGGGDAGGGGDVVPSDMLAERLARSITFSQPWTMGASRFVGVTLQTPAHESPYW